jgi:hypothetical protein
MEKAATLVMLQPSAPAREPTAWMHAPSQPLMRSLLSQIQTPTAPRRTSRFFRVWLLVRSPCRADHSAYFGVARFISPILSAVDASQIKQSLHRCQRKSQRENEISVNGSVENAARIGLLAASRLPSISPNACAGLQRFVCAPLLTWFFVSGAPMGFTRAVTMTANNTY